MKELAKKFSEGFTGTLNKVEKVAAESIDDAGEFYQKAEGSKHVKKAASKAINYVEATAERISKQARIEVGNLKSGDPDKTKAIIKKLQAVGVDIDETYVIKRKASALATATGITEQEAFKKVSAGNFLQGLEKEKIAAYSTEFRKNEVGKIKNVVLDSYKKRVIEPHTNDLLAEVLDNGGKGKVLESLRKHVGGGLTSEQIEKKIADGTVGELLKGKSYGKIRGITTDLHKAVVSNRMNIRKELEKNIGMNFFERHLLPIDEKIAAGADYARLKGDKPMFNVLKNFYKRVNDAQAFETMADQTLKENRAILSKYDPDKRKVLFDYIGKRKIGYEDIDTGMGTKYKMAIDSNLAKEMGLSLDDVKAANAVQNRLRLLQEMGHARYNNKYSTELFYEKMNDVNRYDNKYYAEGVNLSYGKVGDFGHNYVPLVPNADHKAKILQAKKDKDPIKELLNSANAWEQEYAFSMTRNTDSKLYQDILLSADPLDSMKQYSRKYINSHVQAEGKAMIEILKQTASMSDPTGTTKGMTRREMPSVYREFITDLENHWTAKWNGGSVPDNIVAKTIAAATDISSAIVLSKNPKMLIFNSAQFITNGQFRSFSDSMRAIIKSPSVSKEFLISTANTPLLAGITNGTHVTNAIKQVTSKTKDPLYKKVLNDYYRNENPDILMESLVDVGDGIVQKIFTAGTPLFTLSDASSRVQGLYATTSYINSVYEKVGAKNIASGIGKDRLFKETHMARFNGLAREEIMSVAGNKEEFISAYARYATRQEMFNYHKIFRPQILDKLGQNWATARAARFMSWPMHYYNYLRAIGKSAEAGDMAPAKALAVQAILWYTTMSTVGGLDIPVISSLADYGINRGPVIGTAKSVAGTVLNHSGMMASPIAVLLTPFALTEEAIQTTLRGGQKNFDFTTNQIYTKAKSNPVYREAKGLKELFDFTEE